MIRALCIALGALVLTSCASQGFPSHGGGKRFFYEQHLVTRAVDEAIAQLDFDGLNDSLEDPGSNLFNVWVIAVNDAGGGNDGGLIGGLPSSFLPDDDADARRDAASSQSGQSSFSSAYSESNRDIDWVRARVCQALLERGINVTWTPAQGSHQIYVLVNELGIAKSGFNMLVYSERQLEARASIEAYYIQELPQAANVKWSYHSLGRGECTTSMYEEYILGAGPINDREETFEVKLGPILGTVEAPVTQTYPGRSAGGDDDAR